MKPALSLDNTTTSWPKPPQVQQAMVRSMQEARGNPGRSGHPLSIEAARLIYEPPGNPDRAEDRIGLLSLTLSGNSPSDVAFCLEREFGILWGPGLHCAPAAHRTLGIFPEGTVRVGLGAFNSPTETGTVLEALSRIIQT